MIDTIADRLDDHFNNPIENPNFHIELRATVIDVGAEFDMPYLSHLAMRDLRDAAPEDGGDIYFAYELLTPAQRTALYIAIAQRFLTHLSDVNERF